MALRVALAFGAVPMPLGAALALMTVAAGCRDNVRFGSTAGTADVGAARLTTGPDVGPAGDAPDGAALAPALPTLDAARDQELPTPAPMGGAWVTCYGNFRPTSTPERDVTRLGLLCGPANGMRMVGTTTVGEAQDVPDEHPFVARAGECFRVFAVASASVVELGIEVRDAKGWPLANDHSSDRYPIVNPDGPFCLFDAGTYRLRVHARKGIGRYALQLWRLP